MEGAPETLSSRENFHVLRLREVLPNRPGCLSPVRGAQESLHDQGPRSWGVRPQSSGACLHGDEDGFPSRVRKMVGRGAWTQGKGGIRTGTQTPSSTLMGVSDEPSQICHLGGPVHPTLCLPKPGPIHRPPLSRGAQTRRKAPRA